MSRDNAELAVEIGLLFVFFGSLLLVLLEVVLTFIMVAQRTFDGTFEQPFGPWVYSLTYLELNLPLIVLGTLGWGLHRLVRQMKREP